MFFVILHTSKLWCFLFTKISSVVLGVANVIFVGAGGLSLWATEIIKALYKEKVNLLVVDLEVTSHLLIRVNLLCF